MKNLTSHLFIIMSLIACNNVKLVDLSTKDNKKIASPIEVGQDITSEEDETSPHPVNVTGMFIACTRLTVSDQDSSIKCRLSTPEREKLVLQDHFDTWTYSLTQDESSNLQHFIQPLEQSDEYDVVYVFDAVITEENLSGAIVGLSVQDSNNFSFVFDVTYENASGYVPPAPVNEDSNPLASEPPTQDVESPPPPTPPTPSTPPAWTCAASGGKTVADACWFYAAANQSCGDICAANKLRYDEATNTVGNVSKSCNSVLDAFGVAGSGRLITGPCMLTNTGLGCHYFSAILSRWICNSKAATSQAAHSNARRACACTD